ncbi:MAG: nucleotidyltransferase domain-containing protein [bacterium]
MAVKVETIDKRDRIPYEAILDVVEQIKTKFKPDKIILFGSYARGDYRPESDVDLLIVMPLNGKSTLRQAIEILQSIEYHFGLDLIVRSPQELKRRIELGDFFLQEAIEQGVVLYESNS